VILEAELPRDARAAFQARGLVAGFRCGLTVPQLADAMQAVSELVANAYRNGEGPITLRLESPDGGLLAYVGDAANGFHPSANGDIGLQVVQATTDDWGVEDGCAWFEIGVSPGS
jgi:anti-sigma regulatory factor (Ser/Thr protein kinase)